jgi:amidase
MEELVFLSTTQLAAAIRAGHVSATEVLEAHLAQIATRNPMLNAIVTRDDERAYERVREADAALARGEVWGPLHGVPFTLKDAHATAGMRTTTGFPPLADYVPKIDSPVTARLKAAGGILMGKTNVQVMLADYQSTNPIFGRTNNPWNVERAPGGSSGGAAAALAAGMTPFERLCCKNDEEIKRSMETFLVLCRRPLQTAWQPRQLGLSHLLWPRLVPVLS